MRISRLTRKHLLPLLWLSCLGGFMIWILGQEGSFEDSVWNLLWGFQDLLQGPLGVLIILPFFVLSSVLVFPNTPLLIISGFVFGSLWGVAIGWAGMVIAASTAYAIGARLGPRWNSDRRSHRLLDRYAARLRSHSFETVLFLRLCWIALDLDAYLAGVLRIPYRPFFLGSILGCLPGCVSVALVGSSLSVDRVGEKVVVGFDPRVLAFAVVIFVIGVGGSRLLRRRGAGNRSGASCRDLNRPV